MADYNNNIHRCDDRRPSSLWKDRGNLGSTGRRNEREDVVLKTLLSFEKYHKF